MYRDDNVNEIDRLTFELGEARRSLAYAHRSAASARKAAAMMLILALICACTIVFGVFFMSVRAPLSAATHGAAREFCNALDEQEREGGE